MGLNHWSLDFYWADDFLFEWKRFQTSDVMDFDIVSSFNILSTNRNSYNMQVHLSLLDHHYIQTHKMVWTRNMQSVWLVFGGVLDVSETAVWVKSEILSYGWLRVWLKVWLGTRIRFIVSVESKKMNLWHRKTPGHRESPQSTHLILTLFLTLIAHSRHHVLRPLFPPVLERHHPFKLPLKDDKNFIFRVLFRALTNTH